MKRRMIPFVATAALAAGLAFAQSPATAPSERPTGQARARRVTAHERMMQELNLSDTQKAQAKTLFEEARDKAKPFREQLRQDRQEMTAAVKADDSARIRALAAKEGKTRGELAAIHNETMAKFYATLTPEQRTKADQIHAQMRQRMREHMEQHRSNTGE